MKKLLIGLALASLMTTQVVANNYCCPQDCNPCCDEQGFDGFYLGGNIGIFSHTAHRNDLDGFLTDNAGWTTVNTDLTLGLQLGYDWVCCNKLIGLVVDWNWVNVDHTLRDEPNQAGQDNFIKSDFDWFTTIRARSGLTVCDTLVYLTIGAAVAKFETRWQDNAVSFSFSDTRWGWTGGFGTECMLWCNWSLGAEVLFLNFSDKVNTSGNNSFGHSDTAWVGRFVLNYRFGDLCNCF